VFLGNHDEISIRVPGSLQNCCGWHTFSKNRFDLYIPLSASSSSQFVKFGTGLFDVIRIDEPCDCDSRILQGTLLDNMQESNCELAARARSSMDEDAEIEPSDKSVAKKIRSNRSGRADLSYGPEWQFRSSQDGESYGSDERAIKKPATVSAHDYNIRALFMHNGHDFVMDTAGLHNSLQIEVVVIFRSYKLTHSSLGALNGCLVGRRQDMHKTQAPPKLAGKRDRTIDG
jgi:hypothetical protein